MNDLEPFFYRFRALEIICNVSSLHHFLKYKPLRWLFAKKTAYFMKKGQIYIFKMCFTMQIASNIGIQ